VTGPGVELAVQVLSDSATVPDEEQLHAWVVAALQQQEVDREITIRIVNQPESQSLNAQYRGQDKPTNVLSFPADLPTEQGKEVQEHWAHLVIHGVLHLLGHAHQQADEAKEMEALETAILALLGYPDPYAYADER
jgi:probable rRNA maturation factor